MRKHALVKDGIVIKVDNLDDSTYTAAQNLCDCVIDIEDQIPSPDVGWKLVGNKLEHANSSLNLDQSVLFQQSAQRLFGQKLSPILVDKMGARNLKLALEGQSVNVSALLNTLGAVKSLAETGALKTARTILVSLKPAYPLYTDILDYAIGEISNFLVSNGFE